MVDNHGHCFKMGETGPSLVPGISEVEIIFSGTDAVLQRILGLMITWPYCDTPLTFVVY